MSKEEIMATPFNEMLDMISCLAIYNGADAKEQPRTFNFDVGMEGVKKWQ